MAVRYVRDTFDLATNSPTIHGSSYNLTLLRAIQFIDNDLLTLSNLETANRSLNSLLDHLHTLYDSSQFELLSIPLLNLQRTIVSSMSVGDRNSWIKPDSEKTMISVLSLQPDKISSTKDDPLMKTCLQKIHEFIRLHLQQDMVGNSDVLYSEIEELLDQLQAKRTMGGYSSAASRRTFHAKRNLAKAYSLTTKRRRLFS